MLRKLQRLGLKMRILAVFSILSILAVWLFYDWVSNAARRHYLEATEEMMVDQVAQMAKVLSVKEESQDLENLLSTSDLPVSAQIYQVKKEEQDSYYYLTNKHGIILFHAQRLKVGSDFSSWQNVRKAMRGEYGARSTRSDKDDPRTSVMHVTLPFYKGQELVGTLTLVKPVRRLHLYLDQARERMLRRAALTLGLILLLGLFLMRRITQPLERLITYVKKLKEDQSAEKPDLPEGEMKLLAEAISHLRQELDGKQYIESYIQALTHEMKSPLAAVQGAVELLGQPEAMSATEQRLLGNINRESQRMNEMIQQLLLLSRLENQQGKNSFEDFDLLKLIHELDDEFTERHQRNLLLTLPGVPVKVHGDRLLWRLALSNLLLNAQQFTPSAGEIELKLAKNEKSLVLEILDEGEGIPDYALNRVEERFYSLPRPGTGAKSSGLGLTIVKEICRLNDAEFTLKNRAKKGAVARLIIGL